MHDAAFPLLHAIHRATDGASTTTPRLRGAVAVLTSAADPARADRLVPLPGESPVLVARLAVWALRRVDEPTIRAAHAVLLGCDDPSLDVEDEGGLVRIA